MLGLFVFIICTENFFIHDLIWTKQLTFTQIWSWFTKGEIAFSVCSFVLFFKETLFWKNFAISIVNGLQAAVCSSSFLPQRSQASFLFTPSPAQPCPSRPWALENSPSSRLKGEISPWNSLRQQRQGILCRHCLPPHSPMMIAHPPLGQWFLEWGWF